MSEPRTATVNVFVHKPLEIEEPGWCVGHPDTRAGYKVDITHYGPEHVVAPSGRVLLKAMLAQAPFSVADDALCLYIEGGDITGSYTVEKVGQLADDLVAAAARLRELERQFAEILAGGGQ